MKLRYSLRSLLILLTIASFIGWRFGQRIRLQSAADEIKRVGGVVYFHSQSPYLVNVPVPSILPFESRVEHNLMMREIESSIERIRDLARLTTSLELRAKTTNPPNFSWIDFVRGTHDDVRVVAVSIPTASVSDDILRTLQTFSTLHTVLFDLDAQYRSLQTTTKSTPEQIGNDMLKIGQDWKRVKKALEELSPNCKTHRTGVTLTSLNATAG